jgi:hypothetical protein
MLRALKKEHWIEDRKKQEGAIRMKKVAMVLSLIALMTFSFTGCEWAGRTAAKAEKGMQTGADKMEKGVKKMEDDFNKGYEDGKK